MRAIVIHGKLDLRTDELPVPEPGGGDVLLRMAYGGICGSDLHYYNEGANGEFVVREPLVPGHEVSGTVELDPSGELAPGTPVTVHPATFGTAAGDRGSPAPVARRLLPRRRVPLAAHPGRHAGAAGRPTRHGPGPAAGAAAAPGRAGRAAGGRAARPDDRRFCRRRPRARVGLRSDRPAHRRRSA